MKRIYFLVIIGALQIIVGSIMTLGAAEPIRKSGDIVIGPGGHYHEQFSILGSGHLSGNFSERNARSFDFLLFDDRGYASYAAGDGTVSPIESKSGHNITVSLNLTNAGTYHLVLGRSGGTQDLYVNLAFVATGLKTNEAVSALIVLAGGLALIGASLTLSVWAWRHGPPPAAPATPSSTPAPVDPFASPSSPPHNPEDDTKIY